MGPNGVFPNRIFKLSDSFWEFIDTIWPPDAEQSVAALVHDIVELET